MRQIEIADEHVPYIRGANEVEILKKRKRFSSETFWGVVCVSKGYFIYIYVFLRVQSFTNELNIHSVTFRFFFVFFHLRRF